MKLTQAQRDKMVERLVWDWVDVIREWALRDEDSLYNFVANNENFHKLFDAELIANYGERFDELPEGIEDKDEEDEEDEKPYFGDHDDTMPGYTNPAEDN